MTTEIILVYSVDESTSKSVYIIVLHTYSFILYQENFLTLTD